MARCKPLRGKLVLWKDGRCEYDVYVLITRAEEGSVGLTVLKVEVGNPANPEVAEEADSNHRIRRSEL
jgi:hypothetical protein